MSVEVIAEIGSNWRVSDDAGENLGRTLKLIDAAASCGVNTVKFQLFRADKLYRDQSRVEQLKPYELPVEWLPEIVGRCNENEVEFLCTPFYLDAVDILGEFVKRWKVASPDIVYDPLLDKISNDVKPVLLSTGFSHVKEIRNALDILEPLDVTLLHCTGGYPTPVCDMNLRRLLDLGEHFFPHRVGFSSHTPVPYLVASSVLYGAEVIEVHFDLDDGLGIETKHSFNPKQLEELVKMARQFEEAKSCGCDMSLDDTVQRTQARRDPSDWLRTVRD